jgi:16S rRNA G527 N7-methylase RsmG
MVTRETSIAEGLAYMGLAADGQTIARLVVLADLLENDAVDQGFLGPNEGPRVVPRHLLESAALVPFLPDRAGPGCIVDVGSGAGLPGLVLAVLGYSVTLIEAQARRAGFLREAATRLGADVTIVQDRAEVVGRGALRESFVSAAARALAEPPVALELCLPLVREGGTVLIPSGDPPDFGARSSMIGTGAAEGEDGRPHASRDRPAGDSGLPLQESRSQDARNSASDSGDPYGAVVTAARTLGGGGPRWHELAVPGVTTTRWVMIVDKLRKTPDRFPRRPGIPKRRPLGGGVASVN